MYWSEFLTVALIHLLAVASPGPDFAVVIRESVSHGRRAGLFTALGVGSGIFLHVAYSLLGIGLVVAQSELLFALLKWLAAAYLLYVGTRLLLAAAKHSLGSASGDAERGTASSTPHGAYWQGFVTHISNPKAVIFWSAILPPFLAVDRPVAPQIVVLGLTGIALDAATLAAYGLFAAAARRTLAGPRLHRPLDGLAGEVFVLIGTWLLVARV
jgi:threonine/homoserine/homoserine lactone efflux protein